MRASVAFSPAGTTMPYPERVKNVQKSMAMIKVVLGERQREKRVRDLRLFAERQQTTALSQLDVSASKVWPPWIPGSDREMPLAAAITFTVVLKTADGGPWKARPPPEALQLTLAHEGKQIPSSKLATKIILRPPAPSRPRLPSPRLLV